jgi:hypothetical protein
MEDYDDDAGPSTTPAAPITTTTTTTTTVRSLAATPETRGIPPPKERVVSLNAPTKRRQQQKRSTSKRQNVTTGTATQRQSQCNQRYNPLDDYNIESCMSDKKGKLSSVRCLKHAMTQKFKRQKCMQDVGLAVTKIDRIVPLPTKAAKSKPGFSQSEEDQELIASVIQKQVEDFSTLLATEQGRMQLPQALRKMDQQAISLIMDNLLNANLTQKKIQTAGDALQQTRRSQKKKMAATVDPNSAAGQRQRRLQDAISAKQMRISAIVKEFRDQYSELESPNPNALHSLTMFREHYTTPITDLGNMRIAIQTTARRMSDDADTADQAKRTIVAEISA